MEQLINLLKDNLFITIIGAITLVQIVPIKIDPWSMIGKALKGWLVGDIEVRLDDLSSEILAEKVNNARWNVLDFANTCRQGRKHTHEEWQHCLNELSWYERYCEKHNIPNGVMEECSKYLRDTYQTRLEKNDFL